MNPILIPESIQTYIISFKGLEEEENVPFYEHVLLDHLLEGFPTDRSPSEDLWN